MITAAEVARVPGRAASALLDSRPFGPLSTRRAPSHIHDEPLLRVGVSRKAGEDNQAACPGQAGQCRRTD